MNNTVTIPLTTTTPQILVVDDDQRLRELLVQFLTNANFRVLAAANSAEARSYLACHNFDLMVIDVMMPGESGFDLTQSLSKVGNIPILLLTARDSLDDKLRGFAVGADDYLTKPFEPSELLARIKVLLKRKSTPQTVDNMQLRGYDFNTRTGSLSRGGQTVYLSSTELILLKTLSQSPRQPFSRDDLAQRIGHRVSERTVDVQITRLRRKIGDDPRKPTTLQTVRHIGYALWPD